MHRYATRRLVEIGQRKVLSGRRSTARRALSSMGLLRFSGWGSGKWEVGIRRGYTIIGVRNLPETCLIKAVLKIPGLRETERIPDLLHLLTASAPRIMFAALLWQYISGFRVSNLGMSQPTFSKLMSGQLIPPGAGDQ